MKVQVLADFIIECTIFDNQSKNKNDDTIKQTMTLEPDLKSTWVPHIDGGSNV